jgi:hypothetical protein
MFYYSSINSAQISDIFYHKAVIYFEAANEMVEISRWSQWESKVLDYLDEYLGVLITLATKYKKGVTDLYVILISRH